MSSQLRLLRCTQRRHGPGGASRRLSRSSQSHNQCHCSCSDPPTLHFARLERKAPQRPKKHPFGPEVPQLVSSSHPRVSPQEAHKAGSCHSFMSTLKAPLCFLREGHLLGLAPDRVLVCLYPRGHVPCQSKLSKLSS